MIVAAVAGGSGGEACGPSLTCDGTDHCCTGPGPINIDPSLNSYFCANADSPCPL